MKTIFAAVLIFAGIGSAQAQAPSGAPAGSTGVCKDGTYSDAAAKRGACVGHKGVKEWFASEAAAPPAKTGAPSAAAPTPVGAAVPSSSAAPAPTTQPPRPATSPASASAGGGNGQVWVNSASKVYHCEGTKYYGKTKAGAYMTEPAAIAAGNHADHGKACKAS